MKKKLLAILLALATILSFPATASAHWDAVVKWEGQSGGGYSYWVYLCESGFSANSRTRLINAADEWNEINGELHFSMLADGTDCQSWLDTGQNVVWAKLANLADGDFAHTDCNLIFGQVDQCEIYVTSDQSWTTGTSCADLSPNTVYNFTWYTGTGSPSSTQIDVESVFVHEVGHAVRVGHNSGDYEDAIMDNAINDDSGSPPDCDPRGIEKDERVYSHDTSAYTQFYGTTH